MAGKEDYVVQEKGANVYGDGVAWVRGSLIGKGSFASVYLATLKNSRSKYSCFPPVMAVKSAEVSVSGSIQKEMEVLNNVKGCPDIIRCFGEETTMGDSGVMSYNLLFEYASGGTLADRIKQSGSRGFPEIEVRVHARSILRGLNHIHGHGYVHCDLKPDNILLVPNSERVGITEFRAKIGDFGFAKRAGQSRKRKLELYWRGTPMYLSPEAVIDKAQEAPSDIWAFGCIVLEMLMGKPPWNMEKEWKAEDIFAKIRAKNELPKFPSGISVEARDFLKVCFVRKSMYRFTCQMLLNHPFVQGFDNDDEPVEEPDEVEDLNEVVAVSSDQSDDEFSWGNDASEEDLLSCSSEEDGDNLAEDKELGAVGSSIGAGFNQANDMLEQISLQGLSRSRQHYPVNFTVTAGI